MGTMSVTIRLTWPECEQAATAGIKRNLLALHDGRPDRYGFKEKDRWGNDIESAAAELAVARYTGLYWTAWARRPRDVIADVGTNVQVRRGGRHGYDLRLHPDDPDDHMHVLVYGTIPEFTLQGWICGEDGKQDEFWSDQYNPGRPAFWVPADRLEPMELLLPTPATEAVL